MVIQWLRLIVVEFVWNSWSPLVSNLIFNNSSTRPSFWMKRGRKLHLLLIVLVVDTLIINSNKSHTHRHNLIYCQNFIKNFPYIKLINLQWLKTKFSGTNRYGSVGYNQSGCLLFKDHICTTQSITVLNLKFSKGYLIIIM